MGLPFSCLLYTSTAENVEDFHFYDTAGFALGDQFRLDQPLASVGVGEVESLRSIYMITLEDYNALSGAGEELAEDEILLYPYKAAYHEGMSLIHIFISLLYSRIIRSRC